MNSLWESVGRVRVYFMECGRGLLAWETVIGGSDNVRSQHTTDKNAFPRSQSRRFTKVALSLKWRVGWVKFEGMKIIRQLLVAAGFLALVPAFSARAQNKDATVWVAPPTGSLLGGGYTSSYLTNIRAKTIAAEVPELRNAIDALDGLGMKSVKGFGLVPAAVSWQTDTPMQTLIEQQAKTGLSYGELLLANSLAAESKQSFARIMAMRKQARSWGELMQQLRVSPDSILTRAKTASRRILVAEERDRCERDTMRQRWFGDH